MTTPLARYFEIVESANIDPAGLDALRDILADNVLLLHCGEFVQGRERALAFHHRKAAKRRAIKHTWTGSVEADGSITADWSEAVQDLQGKEFLASGHAAVTLDVDGRIAHLNLSLASASDRARLLTAKHMQVWTIPDPGERAKAMEDIYAENFTFMEPEPDNVFVGRDALNDYISVVQQKAPPVSIEVESYYQNREFVFFRCDALFPGGKTSVGWEVLHTKGDLLERIVIFSPNHEVVTENLQ
ncbi:hypothetical protein [Streptomyces sp. NPDC052721]|uniref:hypothetical protein n=1 Tax=Streptomyces sp. NPDC052721 TaxID=3154955 RepID=UPI00341CDCE0